MFERPACDQQSVGPAAGFPGRVRHSGCSVVGFSRASLPPSLESLACFCRELAPVPMNTWEERPRDAWSCLFNRSTGSHPCSPPTSARTRRPAAVEKCAHHFRTPCHHCDAPPVPEYFVPLTCCNGGWGLCWRPFPKKKKRPAERPHLMSAPIRICADPCSSCTTPAFS